MTGSWLAELRRVLLIVAVSGVIGWIVGHPLPLILMGLSTVVLIWLYQLWRIRTWLEQPDTPPPESYGIWGYIFDQIYSIQRMNREARTLLQSSVDYLEDSFASMRDGVVMVDNHGSINWCNAAATSMFTLQFPLDRGQPLLNLVRMPEFQAYFSAQDFDDPLTFDATGDVAMTLQVEITGFGDGNKLLFFRDVTRMVQMEQMRRDFVANVSHELRTPLTVIKGYLETIIANDQDLDPRYQKPLRQMDQQAIRMETLLKDLLWLSRIESVRTVQKTIDVDIAGMLEELRDELRESHPETPINLDIETRQAVLGDYRELYSAVSNLALNAIRYNRDNNPVDISWRHEGNELLLTIQDHGIGIDSIHLPRLTERFYRADESRSTQTGGTGLGLAIVKHVAVSHRADLRIESRLGSGSSFTLAFVVQTIDT
ncbi:MAG: phosphate regulon sensor histidine kinase PhoR [Halioglobus sp.]